MAIYPVSSASTASIPAYKTPIAAKNSFFYGTLAAPQPEDRFEQNIEPSVVLSSEAAIEQLLSKIDQLIAAHPVVRLFNVEGSGDSIKYEVTFRTQDEKTCLFTSTPCTAHRSGSRQVFLGYNDDTPTDPEISSEWNYLTYDLGEEGSAINYKRERFAHNLEKDGMQMHTNVITNLSNARETQILTKFRQLVSTLAANSPRYTELPQFEIPALPSSSV
jgi:hypothetical protein